MVRRPWGTWHIWSARAGPARYGPSSLEGAMKAILFATILVLGLAPAAGAVAAPNPSPVAPAHTGTACVNVIGHNPQAGPDSHSATPAQTNFGEVGAAFCS